LENDKKSEVIIFEDKNGEISLEVSMENDTVWLSQKQMELLFGRDQSVISRHLNNIFKDEELDKESNMQKMHIANSDKPVSFYNLDVIISLGYRVNSRRATQFRKWATKILKDYLIKGYALNQKNIQQNRLNELTTTIELIKESVQNRELTDSEAKGFLEIINTYAKSWAMLQGYDEDSLSMIQGSYEQKFILDFHEAREAISKIKHELMQKGEATELFGNEKADELQGIIRNIYQTFGGDDLIPSVEEKAANLLYYIIKDHPFSDGNKRIGSFLFILFLSKNKILHKPSGELIINDNALVSLALLIATSDPKQKELLIKLVINMLGE